MSERATKGRHSAARGTNSNFHSFLESRVDGGNGRYNYRESWGLKPPGTKGKESSQRSREDNRSNKNSQAPRESRSRGFLYLSTTKSKEERPRHVLMKRWGALLEGCVLAMSSGTRFGGEAMALFYAREKLGSSRILAIPPKNLNSTQRAADPVVQEARVGSALNYSYFEGAKGERNLMRHVQQGHRESKSTGEVTRWGAHNQIIDIYHSEEGAQGRELVNYPQKEQRAIADRTNHQRALQSAFRGRQFNAAHRSTSR